MNRDDIIRMAQEAGIVVTGEAVWKLCEIVAAAERDRCILILERLHERSGGQYNYYLHAAKVLKGEV